MYSQRAADGENNISEKEAVVELLQLYKDFPCLWNNTDKLYCNKDARNEAMKILFEKWKQYYPRTNINELKRKLTHLRAAYRRERNKVESSKTSGAGVEDIYMPTLWYYNHLSFLNEIESPTSEGIDILNIENIEEPTKKNEKHSLKRQNANLYKKQEDLIESAKRLIENTHNNSTSEETSAGAFGHLVGSQLNELPKIQRCIAEKLIGELLFYAKLGQLTLDATININKNIYSHTSTHSFYAQPYHQHLSRFSLSPQHSQISPYQQSLSPQLSQTSPYQLSPSPQHSQTSSYQPSPSPQHSQTSPYQLSPSPQLSQTSPYQPSLSPQHSQASSYQPSSSPQHSQKSLYQLSPSPQHTQTTGNQTNSSSQHLQKASNPPSQSPQYSQASSNQPSSLSQHSLKSLYQLSPSPQHTQTSGYQIHSSSQHSQITSNLPSQSPQHSQPSPYQPSSSPQYSQTLSYHPSLQSRQLYIHHQSPQQTSALLQHPPPRPSSHQPTDLVNIYLVDPKSQHVSSNHVQLPLSSDFPNTFISSTPLELTANETQSIDPNNYASGGSTL